MQIALCWLLGVGSGLLYDAFKVLRRDSGKKALSAFLDTLFCLMVCFALFVAGMSAGEGSLGLAMLAFAIIGFVCYMLFLSDRIFGLLRKAFGKFKALIALVLLPIRKVFVKISKMIINLFSRVRNWIKIRRSAVEQSVARKQNSGGKIIEEGEDKHRGRHCDYSDDSLWRIQHDINARTDSRGRENRNGAQS